jgi:hypothetical protein
MQRTKRKIRKFTHEQLSRILSMAAAGLIRTKGGYWADHIWSDEPYACPLQAAYNIPQAHLAARLDKSFAKSFDGEATIWPESLAWHPTVEEMLFFTERKGRY